MGFDDIIMGVIHPGRGGGGGGAKLMLLLFNTTETGSSSGHLTESPSCMTLNS